MIDLLGGFCVLVALGAALVAGVFTGRRRAAEARLSLVGGEPRPLFLARAGIEAALPAVVGSAAGLATVGRAGQALHAAGLGGRERCEGSRSSGRRVCCRLDAGGRRRCDPCARPDRWGLDRAGEGGAHPVGGVRAPGGDRFMARAGPGRRPRPRPGCRISSASRRPPVACPCRGASHRDRGTTPSISRSAQGDGRFGLGVPRSPACCRGTWARHCADGDRLRRDRLVCVRHHPSVVSGCEQHGEGPRGERLRRPGCGRPGARGSSIVPLSRHDCLRDLRRRHTCVGAVVRGADRRSGESRPRARCALAAGRSLRGAQARELERSTAGRLGRHRHRAADRHTRNLASRRPGGRAAPCIPGDAAQPTAARDPGPCTRRAACRIAHLRLGHRAACTGRSGACGVEPRSLVHDRRRGVLPQP